MSRCLALGALVCLAVVWGCGRESATSKSQDAMPTTDRVGGHASIALTDDNFREIVGKSDKLVLVDFYAEWCQPCKDMAPILEKIAADYRGRAVIGKLDAEKNVLTATRFQIEAYPTLILFKQGEPIERLLGGQSESQLKTLLDGSL